MTYEDSMSLRVLLLRSSHRMTQEELATVIQVSRSTIRDWENGAGRPSAVKLYEMARFFHVPMESFFSAEDSSDSEMISVPKPLAITTRELMMAVDRMSIGLDTPKPDTFVLSSD